MALTLRRMILKYMNEQEGFSVFVDRVVSLMQFYILFHTDENITVAFCCSAGEYRSPAVALAVAGRMKGLDVHYKLEQSKNSKL